MWDLDFGQNTKVVGNILKYFCVKFGDVSTSFDRPNPPWKTVKNSWILSYWYPFTFWPILATFNTSYITPIIFKLHIHNMPFPYSAHHQLHQPNSLNNIINPTITTSTSYIYIIPYKHHWISSNHIGLNIYLQP